MGHSDTTGTKEIKDSGLLIIGLFKLLKALFFIGVGFGALHFLKHDLVETLQHLVDSRGYDPENRFVGMIIDKAELITDHRLKLISVGTFGYAALALTEGIGLLRRKVWAEYLTLWLSISFLPWEVYELVFHGNWWRVVILVSNLAIVAYLLWFLKRKKRPVA